MAVRRFNVRLGRVPVCIVGDAEMADESGGEISKGVVYTDPELYKNAGDTLAVYAQYDSETAKNMFDDNDETYFGSQYLNFHSSKGNIKEIILDVESTYWNEGIEVWGANDDNREIGTPTTNMGYWEVIGTLPIGYGERKIVRYTLDKTYKYLGFYIDRKQIYSMSVVV